MRAKLNSPIVWLMFIFTCLVLALIHTFASEDFSVVVPIQQDIANHTLSYQVAPQNEKAVLPQEAATGTVNLSGKENSELTFHFVRPGQYLYTVTPNIPATVKLAAHQARYDLEISVFYNDNGKLESNVIIKDTAGYKVDSLKFNTPAKVPVTTMKTTTTPNAKKRTGVPITGKLPQTGDLITSFSWLGLLLIAIAVLKMLKDRHANKRME